MFTTFSAQMTPVFPTKSVTPSNGTSGRRRKVSRACDSCRLNRVKCDDDRPCENCHSRGEKCTIAMPWEAHSLPAAKREIKRLQDKLRQLQKQQSAASFNDSRKIATENETPPTPPDTSVNTANTKPTVSQQSNNQYVLIANDENQTIHRQRSPWDTYTNSSSWVTPTLTDRMGHYVKLDLPYLEQGTPPSDGRNESHTTFPRNKERRFLSLFWKGYPWLQPVIDREEIYHHHDSLWNDAPPGEQQPRLPSPLIDLLLALSMQYGSTFLSHSISDSTRWGANAKNINASLAGQSFCHRSHRLYLERPLKSTFQSVQCCILSTIYLLNAGSLDRAQVSLAAGVRMAQILGLHESSPFTSPVSKQERLRIKTWRLLIAMDGYCAILLGLPPLIQPVAEERLVMDCWQRTILDETNDDYDQIGSWETHHVNYTKLILSAQSVHEYFLRMKGELLRQGYGGDLESFGQSMTQKLEIMQRWAENVPPALKVHRPGGCGPFSVVWVPIFGLGPQAPLYLQQQRLSLELGYHHLSLLLVRSVVRFMLGYRHIPQSKQVDSHFVDGLKHAISIVSIINQALTNGDGITGWLLFFRWQWDATLYLLNYITVYPVGPLAADTRRSLSTAIETFAVMENYLEMAKSAQKIVQDVLRRDPAQASSNESQAPDLMSSATTVPMSLLSFSVDEASADLQDDQQYSPAPKNEFSQRSAASTIELGAFEPLDTLSTEPDIASFTYPSLLDSALSWSSLMHQDSDDILEMHPVVGDWHLSPFIS
ncbi:hypothetical protein E0Z10_g5962 [Xylaria hypoxylon]|uniref:Zn(2)-C6 fungal-type domain-containing protein n=1 Tax=Xylaria hypoxylon TaxID=37992 RepID=A0A4Z0YRY9_9PEZI|nr:hypothetical protein E0Z10_g5962 [Xylaria hypoxylon]